MNINVYLVDLYKSAFKKKCLSFTYKEIKTKVTSIYSGNKKQTTFHNH